jgi:hypothetical protein
MPPVKNVGKPCAGEPHARFDGRELEMERTGYGHGEERPSGKLLGTNGFVPYFQNPPPRQLPTLPVCDLAACRDHEDGHRVIDFKGGWISKRTRWPCRGQ